MGEANVIPMDFAQAQAGYRRNAEARRHAADELEAALYDKAQAEHEYRKALSVAYAKHRGQKMAQTEAEIHAKADAAHHALQRDMADARAKGMSARLAELEAERASLRNLFDASRQGTGEAA